MQSQGAGHGTVRTGTWSTALAATTTEVVGWRASHCRAEQRRPFHHLHVPLHGSCKRRFINHLLIPITKVTPQLLCKVRATPLQLSCHLRAYTWFLNNATVGVPTLNSVKKKPKHNFTVSPSSAKLHLQNQPTLDGVVFGEKICI